MNQQPESTAVMPEVTPADEDPKVLRVLSSTVTVGLIPLTVVSHPSGLDQSVPDIAINRTNCGRTVHLPGCVRDSAAFDVVVDPGTFAAANLTALLGKSADFSATCVIDIGGVVSTATLAVPCYLQAVKPSGAVESGADGRTVTYTLTLQPTNVPAA